MDFAKRFLAAYTLRWASLASGNELPKNIWNVRGNVEYCVCYVSLQGLNSYVLHENHVIV